MQPVILMPRIPIQTVIPTLTLRVKGFRIQTASGSVRTLERPADMDHKVWAQRCRINAHTELKQRFGEDTIYWRSVVHPYIDILLESGMGDDVIASVIPPLPSSYAHALSDEEVGMLQQKLVQIQERRTALGLQVVYEDEGAWERSHGRVRQLVGAMGFTYRSGHTSPRKLKQSRRIPMPPPPPPPLPSARAWVPPLTMTRVCPPPRLLPSLPPRPMLIPYSVPLQLLRGGKRPRTKQSSRQIKGTPTRQVRMQDNQGAKLLMTLRSHRQQ